MKDDNGNGSGSHGMPHGMPEGTIKEVYSQIKGHGDAKVSGQYMKNMQNQLRLVFWETTAGCNLECIHCRRIDVSTQLMNDDLTTKESFELVDAITEAGNPILVLSGGEPLFRPDIFDIAKYAVKQGLTVALATNGTLVDEAMAKKIVDSGVSRVAISLDGADADTHDKFRKLKGSFDLAIKGFKNLLALGMGMQVNCTIAKHNAHQFRDLYNLAVNLGAEAIHIFMLVPVGCGVEIAEDQMLPAEKYEELLNLFYDLSKEAVIQTKATCSPHYFRIMRERAKEEGVKITPKTHGMAAMTKGCLAGTGVCFVPVEAGHIKKQKFVDIWKDSAVFAKLRQPDLLGGKCGLCEYKKVWRSTKQETIWQKSRIVSTHQRWQAKSNLDIIFTGIFNGYILRWLQGR